MAERGHLRIEQNAGYDVSNEFDCVSSKQRPDLRNKAIEFTKVVSLIGIRHAVDPKKSKIRKFIWICWLVFGCGFAIYQIQDRIAYYNSYPVSTEVEVVNAEKLPLPQVTICYFHYDAQNGFMIWDFKDRYKDMYNAQAMVAGNTIEEKELTTTDMGGCIAFNAAKSELVTEESAVMAGLQIKLYRHDRAKLLDGYRITLDDPSDFVFMNDNSFTVPYESTAQIILSLENITMLGPPYGDCNDDTEYTFAKCTAKWEQKILEKELGCRHPFLEDLCRLRYDPGPCTNYVEKWFFDSFNRKCHRFNYGGCGGNDNRFNSENECMSACKDMIDICRRKLEDRGPCKTLDLYDEWNYDPINQTCRLFRDCKRNKMFFVEENECLIFCRDVPDSCRTPEDPGFCEGNFRRSWFYDSINQKCHEISYRDCNRKYIYFNREEDCYDYCRSVPDYVSTCLLNVDGMKNSFAVLSTQDRSPVLSLCPRQCHRRIFKYSVIYSRTFENENSESTLLYINYPHFLYTDIRQFPSYSFLNLLCDVGGALSMLLGATLLTIYEVGEFLFLITSDYMRFKLNTHRPTT